MAEQTEQLDETIQLLSDLLQSGQDSEFIESFEALHDFEMAQVYAELPEQFRAVAWRLLPTDVLAAVFDNLDVDEVDIAGLLAEMPPQRGAQILQEMYTDNAVDLLQEMPSGQIATYLSLMPKADADSVRKLINYDDQTAGSLMSTEYLAVKEDLKVGEVMRLVKRQALEAESISYVYVLDQQGLLVGVISLRDLLTHPDDMPVSEITNDRIISVRAGDDQQEVAQIVADYNFLSIPVTDDKNHLLGVITVDDIVDVIDEEAVEDYSGLAAVNVSQINDSPWHSAVKRIPWLIALLLLGMLTATVIGSFDGLVRQVAILAAFISLITGTAGNAGTQSLALAVRRIAVGSENSGLRDFLSEVIARTLERGGRGRNLAKFGLHVGSERVLQQVRGQRRRRSVDMRSFAREDAVERVGELRHHRGVVRPGRVDPFSRGGLGAGEDILDVLGLVLTQAAVGLARLAGPFQRIGLAGAQAVDHAVGQAVQRIAGAQDLLRDQGFFAGRQSQRDVGRAVGLLGRDLRRALHLVDRPLNRRLRQPETWRRRDDAVEQIGVFLGRDHRLAAAVRAADEVRVLRRRSVDLLHQRLRRRGDLGNLQVAIFVARLRVRAEEEAAIARDRLGDMAGICGDDRIAVEQRIALIAAAAVVAQCGEQAAIDAAAALVIKARIPHRSLGQAQLELQRIGLAVDTRALVHRAAHQAVAGPGRGGDRALAGRRRHRVGDGTTRHGRADQRRAGLGKRGRRSAVWRLRAVLLVAAAAGRQQRGQRGREQECRYGGTGCFSGVVHS